MFVQFQIFQRLSRGFVHEIRPVSEFCQLVVSFIIVSDELEFRQQQTHSFGKLFVMGHKLLAHSTPWSVPQDNDVTIAVFDFLVEGEAHHIRGKRVGVLRNRITLHDRGESVTLEHFVSSHEGVQGQLSFHGDREVFVEEYVGDSEKHSFYRDTTIFIPDLAEITLTGFDIRDDDILAHSLLELLEHLVVLGQLLIGEDCYKGRGDVAARFHFIEIITPDLNHVVQLANLAEQLRFGQSLRILQGLDRLSLPEESHLSHLSLFHLMHVEVNLLTLDQVAHFTQDLPGLAVPRGTHDDEILVSAQGQSLHLLGIDLLVIVLVHLGINEFHQILLIPLACEMDIHPNVVLGHNDRGILLDLVLRFQFTTGSLVNLHQRHFSLCIVEVLGQVLENRGELFAVLTSFHREHDQDMFVLFLELQELSGVEVQHFCLNGRQQEEEQGCDHVRFLIIISMLCVIRQNQLIEQSLRGRSTVVHSLASAALGLLESGSHLVQGDFVVLQLASLGQQVLLHGLLDHQQVSIAHHTGRSEDSVVLGVEGQELVVLEVAIDDHLVEALGVTGVGETLVVQTGVEEGQQLERHNLAQHVESSDLALLDSLVVVFHPDVLPGVGIRHTGHVTSHVGVRQGTPQERVGLDPPVLVQGTLREERHVGSDAAAHDDHVGRQDTPVSQLDSSDLAVLARKGLDLGIQLELDSLALRQFPERVSHLDSQHPLERGGFLGDDSDVLDLEVLPESTSSLHANKTAPYHDHLAVLSDSPLHLLQVLERPPGEHVLKSAAFHLRHDGRPSRGHQELLVVHLPPVLGEQVLVVVVHHGYLHSFLQGDVVLLQELFVPQLHLLDVGAGHQFGQQGSVVGHVRLVSEHHDLPFEPALSQSLGTADASRAGSDDHEPSGVIASLAHRQGLLLVQLLQVHLNHGLSFHLLHLEHLQTVHHGSVLMGASLKREGGRVPGTQHLVLHHEAFGQGGSEVGALVAHTVQLAVHSSQQDLVTIFRTDLDLNHAPLLDLSGIHLDSDHLFAVVLSDRLLRIEELVSPQEERGEGNSLDSLSESSSCDKPSGQACDSPHLYLIIIIVLCPAIILINYEANIFRHPSSLQTIQRLDLVLLLRHWSHSPVPSGSLQDQACPALETLRRQACPQGLAARQDMLLLHVLRLDLLPAGLSLHPPGHAILRPVSIPPLLAPCDLHLRPALCLRPGTLPLVRSHPPGPPCPAHRLPGL